MIPFFRKIRKKLADDNPTSAMASDGIKTGKYLKYAVGEIVLLVIGILIALSINNWSERQKLEAKRQDYYNQLLEDLKKDDEFTEIIIEKFKKNRAEYEVYSKSYFKSELTPTQVYNNLLDLNNSSTALTFNSSTIESLQNSGDIGMISPTIRNKLIDLRRYQDLTIKRADYIDKGKNEVLQSVSLLLGSYPLQDRLLSQPKLKEFLNIDENLKELILALEGSHRWKDLSEKETIGRLNEMKMEIETIVALINKEVKK